MSYSNLDSDEQVAFSQKRLTTLMSKLGGKLVTKTDDSSVELRTRAHGRAVRVHVALSWGRVSLQMKLANTTGVLVLDYDADKQPATHERDEWDAGTELRIFLAPGLFIEETEDEARAMWELLGRLPAELVQEIKAAFPGTITYLKVDASEIDVNCAQDVDAVSDDKIQELWTFCDRIARVFEAGTASVASKPKLYISGQAAHVATMTTCPNCNTVSDTSVASFCSNCGAPLKPRLA